MGCSRPDNLFRGEQPSEQQLASLTEICRTSVPGYDPNRDAGECTFHAARAWQFCRFVERACRHIEGKLAGHHLHLEPWQIGIIGNLFGWIRPDGNRRYRTAFVYVPRKNGKTTLIATVVLAVLFGDGEAGAQCYSAAADREQASLIFRIVKGMILQQPELERLCKVYQKEIQTGNAFYRAISSEASTKHGFNTHLAVVDELHAHPNRELVDVLSTSMGAREQPLLVYTTTADFQGVSACNDEHSYAIGVRDGTIADATYLPVIFEAQREDDWQDPAVWRKANPNLGVSVTEEFLAKECNKAKALPSFQNEFRRLYLNVQTEQSERWLPMDAWGDCSGRVAIEDLDGMECYGGLDLASQNDIAAFVLAFDVDGITALLPTFWIPEDSIEQRVKQHRVPYQVWRDRGWLKATPGKSVDFNRVEEDIGALLEQYHVLGVRTDPWNAKHMADRLEMQFGLQIEALPQSISHMNSPSKRLEKLIVDRKLEHFDNPVLTWMAGNASAKRDNYGNIMPHKGTSPEKIDGIVAAVMAIGQLELHEESGQGFFVL